ncbi:hypothetical protein EV363DRAFT_1299529 [Boletus edulis]|nr:hypothetical protein EV363DRAFT_1299529 [Boletus edulis]
MAMVDLDPHNDLVATVKNPLLKSAAVYTATLAPLTTRTCQHSETLRWLIRFENGGQNELGDFSPLRLVFAVFSLAFTWTPRDAAALLSTSSALSFRTCLGSRCQIPELPLETGILDDFLFACCSITSAYSITLGGASSACQRVPALYDINVGRLALALALTAAPKLDLPLFKAWTRNALDMECVASTTEGTSPGNDVCSGAQVKAFVRRARVESGLPESDMQLICIKSKRDTHYFRGRHPLYHKELLAPSDQLIPEA